MKKFLILFSLIFFFLSSSIIIFAQSSNSNIPEKNGDYPDPQHPGVRVRVFVHEPKTQNAIVATCDDPSSDYMDGLTGWLLPSSVTYNLNTTGAPSSVGSNFPTIAQNSFTVWQDAVSSKVTFSRGPDTRSSRQSLDYQNIVAFGRTSGSALAVTYTRYYKTTKQVVDVDTIFNKKFAWSWTPYSSGICGASNSYDVQNILTHELGHWMGLNDQYEASYAHNTMYGYGSKGEIKKDTLTNGDTAPLSSLYH